jgi:4-hydroxy-tetrahydrodipicolinate reductase
MAIRVGVAGALGRMGRSVCVSVMGAPDMELVGGFDRTRVGEDLRAAVGLYADAGRIYDDLAEFYEEAKPEVVVDFTVYPITVEVAREAVARGVSPVVGATGWTEEDEKSFASVCAEHGIGAALVPNFALGAVMMMRFAEEAARYFPTCEIVELHHDRKLDKPSGTAKLTARRITAVAGRDVPVHSVRLRGLVAHQEVIFGNDGETLTIRHDSLSRDSFMAGVLLAIRGVRAKRELVVGLERFMETALT